MTNDNSDFPKLSDQQGLRNIPYSMQHYMHENHKSDAASKDSVRSGPNPLPVHLGFATISERELNDTNAADNMLRMMVQGIKRYQSHPYKRDMKPFPEVWRAGEVSVSLCTASNARASIVLIPSMINKSYILDLLPERSLARWLNEQGMNVYFLDWGDPLKDEQLDGMDQLIQDRLLKALEFTISDSELPLFALGYCMGGTLMTGAIQNIVNEFAGLIYLASPWDFHDGDQPLTENVSKGLDLAMQMIAQHNYLPADWIQSIFAAVNADRSANKFKNFDLMDQDSDRAVRFVAVEDWLNDPVHLPAKLAKECLSLWYEKNVTANNEWSIKDELVDLKKMNIPSLVVFSEKDRLVPAQSSRQLYHRLPQAECLVPDTGHIGMIAGGQAPEIVWTPILNWIDSVL